MGPEYQKKQRNNPDLLRYDSLSEARVAHCLEKFIPHWKPIEGETFQIPIGRSKIDFRVHELFIEYHPIIISRELKSSRAREIHNRLCKRLHGYQKSSLVELLEHELGAQYWTRRNGLIQAHPNYAGCELVVVSSPMEFYKDVIKRFCEGIKFKQFAQVWNVLGYEKRG